MLYRGLQVQYATAVCYSCLIRKEHCTQKSSVRLKKMEQDCVKLLNRFEILLDGDLADEEMEADQVPSKL